jgi:hypothetical protein
MYKPYKGLWSSKVMNGGIKANSHDILLNNGRNYDFYLIPTDVKGVVNFFAKINERNYAVKATLPPLAAGSLKQLILRKGKRVRHISSGWKANLLLSPQPINAVDTVKSRLLMQKKDISLKRPDSNSIALIIDTDGKMEKPSFTRCWEVIVSQKASNRKMMYHHRWQEKRRCNESKKEEA